MWSGTSIAEERDSLGTTVTKRFFAEGEQRLVGSDAGSYYYTRDHLGSIREVVNSSGVVKGMYDYDAWGNSAVVSGTMTLDFGYTGHYFHQQSGLNLSLYRAYNPAMGRWLSRDPLGETAGINLYAYVSNNSVSALDPFGLDAVFLVGSNAGHGNPGYFDRIASKYAVSYEQTHPGQSARIVDVASFDQIQTALGTSNIDQLTYFGHASDTHLFLTATTSLSAADVGRLDTKNVNRDAQIALYGCHTGKGSNSIAQAFANRFGVDVSAFSSGLSFGIPGLNWLTESTNSLVRGQPVIVKPSK